MAVRHSGLSWGMWVGLVAAMVTACGCTEVSDREVADDAVRAVAFAIEQNVAGRSFTRGACGATPWGRLKVSVVAVPLNEEIVRAAVGAAVANGQVTKDEAAEAAQAAVSRYVEGDHASVIVVVNVDGPGEAKFRRFSDSTFLRDETRQRRLLRHTGVFGQELAPGQSWSYLRFANFRGEGSESYSIHLPGLDLTCESTQEEPAFAFPFDESSYSFLALVEQGLDDDAIRQRLGIGPDRAALLGSVTVGDILGMVLSVVLFAAAS